MTEATYRRLRDYKMRRATFDEVVNKLMRSVTVEVLAERVIKDNHERMREREGSPWRQVLEKGKRRA